MGATIIGGCCETTPAHIAEIAQRLVAAGHRIV
jgi:homocysteine S-methyltransferase